GRGPGGGGRRPRGRGAGAAAAGDAGGDAAPRVGPAGHGAAAVGAVLGAGGLAGGVHRQTGGAGVVGEDEGLVHLRRPAGLARALLLPERPLLLQADLAGDDAVLLRGPAGLDRGPADLHVPE